MVEKTVEGGSPSSVAEASAFEQAQRDGHLLNGRPTADREGLPVGLYSPVFDKFSAALETEPDEINLGYTSHRKTSELCTCAVYIYDEEQDRWSAIKPLLEVILGERIENKTTTTGGASEGVIYSQVGGHQVLRVIFEIENEIGTGGFDPSVRGAFSYHDYYSRSPVRGLTISYFLQKITVFARLLRFSSFITAHVSSSRSPARGFVS